MNRYFKGTCWKNFTLRWYCGTIIFIGTLVVNLSKSAIYAKIVFEVIIHRGFAKLGGGEGLDLAVRVGMEVSSMAVLKFSTMVLVV